MDDSRAPVQRLTPPGVGGVAVVAVRSAEARDQLTRLFGRTLPGPGRVAYGRLTDPGAPADAATIDEVLVVGREGGNVEVHLHGSPGLVADVVARLAGQPALDAEAAASLEERAAALAPLAPTGQGARLLLDQARGALRNELESLREATPKDRARGVAALVRRGTRARRLLRPSTVALVGPVNAGKSTLFNVLAGEEIAAVTTAPGTTRDALGSLARFARIPVLLVDTAGRRDLDRDIASGERGARVEREGQALAARVSGRADLVLELAPASPKNGPGAPPSGLRPLTIRLATKAVPALGDDAEQWGAGVVSALEHPEHARRTVARIVEDALDPAPQDEPVWSPGVGVPFEPELLASLTSLVEMPEVDRSALASLLRSL